MGVFMAEIKSICVFCGSSSAVAETHKDAARRFGAILAENGVRLIYGGGRVGLMGLVADGAAQAGGEVIGVIPDFLERIEVGNREISELVVTDSMHARKAKMYELADAFVTLPGGLGSLDETFEVITWTQLKLSAKPFAVVNIDGYWQPLLALIDHVIAAGFARPANRDILQVVDDVEAVLPALRAIERAPDIDQRQRI
ncbi:MAG: TIGR00730 family Rossman fold protein [Pseudomonadota bacterium]|nr:TIGR00730 family Rossman fold protein [Pseudomonadota bacterium]